MIERYGHGGDIWTAAETYQLNPDQLLDYSSNINPFGIPSRLLPELQKRMPEIVRYPDPSCRNLRKQLSKTLATNISPDHILVGNGGAECLHLAVTALAPEKVGIIYPSFSEYESISVQAGCQIVGIPTTAENNFLPKVDDLLLQVKHVDMLFLGHPNNPTGNYLQPRELLQVAEACEEEQTYLCVDEAFIDFIADGDSLSLLPHITKFKHVLVFRSMTKMFAIAGLRLGYVVSQPDVIEKLSRKQISWSVNHLAQIAGELLLEEHDFVEETKRYVKNERERITGILRSISELICYPSEVNYLLLQLKTISSATLQEEMAKRGVLIRNCSMYPGLTDGFIRIAIKTKEENDIMIAVLMQALQAITYNGEE
ncbi:threonine-phosphate decarboxylase CobD [Brevibacillus daliensis]|uniref:threonine-phosphate decarboxylase CobD n=1 Tax=Brevibacillus daliensis TaxID=2892995 RepID=UPI001E2F5E8F|nr:threonine-phosphate decarboxylase CobD [Brevibacillus daliensis]